MARKSTASAAPIIFGEIPTVITATKPAKKGKATPQRSIKGMRDVAALRAVIAALEAVCVEKTRQVKEQMDDEFVADGIALKRRPPNFEGVEGFGTGSCQLRATGVALSEETIELCKKYGIELNEDVKVESTYKFNPAYISDPKFVEQLNQRVGPQLAQMQDVRGPIIQTQVGESKFKPTDAGMDAVFTYPEPVVRELLPAVFTTALKPKLNTDGDLKPALEVVEELLGTPLWGSVAKEAANDPEALNKKTKERNKRTAKAAA